MILRTTPLKTALALSASLAAILTLAPALAAAQTVQTSQTARAEASVAPDAEALVVVTGSRIATRTNQAISPVRVITAEEIQATGQIDIDEVLKTQNSFLPSNGATTNPTLLESHGASTLDMRGLGQNRTLVLVNGQRAVPNGFRNSVDVNIIPNALIARIETLTGGAAAVYGADAVAGVTNFILRDSYEGLEVTGTYGQSSRADSEIVSVGITAGTALFDERLNIMGHFGYTERGGILRTDRSWAVPEVNDAGLPLATFATGGGNFQRFPTSTATTPTTAPLFVYNPAGTLLTGAGLATQTESFSFLEAFANPNDRTNYALFANYRVTDWLTIYGRGLYTVINNTSQQLPVRSNGQGVNQDVLVQRNNPFITANAALSAALATQWNLNAAGTGAGTDAMRLRVNRTMLEFGPLTDTTERRSQQYVIGLKGNITDTISYELSYVNGVNIEEVYRVGWGSGTRYRQAINIVNVNGQAQCADTSGGCIPFNIFGGPNSGSAAAVAWINGDTGELFNKRNRHQEVLSLVLTGDTSGLFELPGGPMSWVVGAEKRDEWGSTVFGPRASTGDTLHTQPPRGSAVAFYDLTEYYAEVRLPVLADLPLVKGFDIEAAYRQTEHSQAGNYDTSKLGFNWELNDSVRLRGSTQTVVRGANIGELFPGINRPGIAGNARPVDYCNDPARFGVPVALCVATGAPTTGGYLVNEGLDSLPFINNAVAVQGGRSDIKPEDGETYTYGIVLTPTAIQGLSIVLDYYSITLNNAIGTITPALNMQACYLIFRDANSAACRAITRNPLTAASNPGQVVSFDQQDTNITLLKTAGWDFSIYYNTALPVGVPGDRVNVSFTGGTVDQWIRQTFAGDNIYNCAGRFSVNYTVPGARATGAGFVTGSGTATGACNDSGTGVRAVPAFRSNLQVAWTAGDLTLRFGWRYTGETSALIGAVFDPNLTNIGSNPQAVQHIDAYDYFDLGGTWFVNENFRVGFAVRNLFDLEPPIMGSAQQDANTLPGQYDIVGRTYSLTATFRMR